MKAVPFLRSRRRIAAVGTAAATLVALVLFASHSAFAATLFSDDFEDGNANGWSKSGGTWTVVTDGSRAYQQSKLDSELARVFAGTSSWTDYTMQARVKPLAFDGSDRYVGIAARASGATTMYRLVLTSGNRAELQAVKSGAVTVLGGVSRTVATGTWYTLRIDVAGTTIRGYVDGAQVASATSSMEDAGRLALLTFHATASFDDVQAVDSGTTPPTTPPGTTAPPVTTPPGTTPPVTTPPVTGPPVTGLVGFGAGTTGGQGGSTVTVTSASALDSALTSSSATIVRVSGMISLSGMHKVASNKTVIGVGSNSGISGGGLNVASVSNVIIRNLVFTGADDDAINVQYSTKVWIDHNDLSNGYDGLIDIKRSSDYVTVSWNHLHNHDKSMLLGHSDDNSSEDVGHLRVTYHHNWLDGTGQRHPRVRFGNPVHVFNNYYSNIGSYGVASTCNAGVLVEGNYFENVSDPYHLGEGSSPAGSLVARNNYMVNSGAGQTGGSVASIPYSYSMDTASSVKSIVTSGAGTGKVSG